MRLIIFCSLWYVFNAYADQHSISAITSFHLDQKSAPGYGFFYQYQPIESMDIETGFIDSNRVNRSQDNQNFAGEFNSVYIGVNALKQYNPSLYIKAGVGLAYVINSSNDTLVNQGQFTPYIKFSGKYDLSNRWALELGQLTQFSSAVLETNHSVFLSLNYTFADRSRRTPLLVSAPPKPLKKAIAKKESVVMAGKATSVKLHTFWTIQLGAFSNESNAEKYLQKIDTAVATKQAIKIVKHKKLYKLLLKEFTNYDDAKLWLHGNALTSLGFVTRID
ncbi:SPOR domain-containing protein [Colwelliaceae bacterium 6471]